MCLYCLHCLCVWLCIKASVAPRWTEDCGGKSGANTMSTHTSESENTTNSSQVQNVGSNKPIRQRLKESLPNKLKQEGTERLELLSQRWTRQDECVLNKKKKKKCTWKESKAQKQTVGSWLGVRYAHLYTELWVCEWTFAHRNICVCE